MDVSVIIVSYNSATYLPTCLASLRTSTGINKEVFVVDNCSRDNSVEIMTQNFPEVKLMVNSENKGFSAANNQALKDSLGRYIVFLNPDTTVNPNTLKNAVTFMDTNRQIGLAGAKILHPDGTLQESVSYKYPGEKFTSGETNCLQGNIACVLGAFMIARKPLLDEIKGFDEDFFLYGEDQNLCWRIRKEGFCIGYIEDAVIFHWGGHSEINTPYVDLFKKKLRAEYLFYSKHYTPETITRIKRAEKLKALYRLGTLKITKPFVKDKIKLQNKIDRYRLIYQMTKF